MTCRHTFGLFLRRREVLRRSHREHDRQQQCTRRPRRLRVDGLRRLVRRAQNTRQHVVRVRPKRLRVRQEREEAGDEWRTPQVGRRPAVRAQLGRGLE